MTSAQLHPLRCETCAPKCQDFRVLQQQDKILSSRSLAEWKRFTALKGCVSHSSAKGADAVLEECKTCHLKGTRACAYHGYPDDTIPKSCRYKVGVDAQFALDNLKGTFIIKNLKQQEREQG
jgi:hypothetical protein